MRKSALYAFALVVAALVALGLLVLSSASEANGVRLHRDAYFFMKRQFLYCGIGLVIAVVTSFVDYHVWQKVPGLAWLAYAGVFISLFFVFPQLGGRALNGSFRWIDFKLFNVQPSEFAKLMVVIILAVWLDRAAWRVELFRRGLLWPGLLVAGLAVPVLFEPDFGSFMVIAAVGGLVMFVAGVKLIHLVPAGLLAMAGGATLMFFNENRMRRLTAFFAKVFGSAAETVEKVSTATMDPAQYQGHMALVAIKNGGLWGVGLGESMQKELYLPECYTDFIFAIGAEELGLLFSVGTLILFLAFFALSVYIARNASDRFGRFLVIGMAFIIFFQAMFNFGVVCEALPTKGMALPFFSYGGTNLMCAFFEVGTILSVGIHTCRDRAATLARSVLMR